jgi:hypothetical protein
VLDDTLLLGSRVQIPGQQELLNEWNSGGYQHENYGHVRLGGGRGRWHAEERLGSPFGPHLYMHAPQLAQVSLFHSPGKDAPMWSLNRL